MMPDPLHPAIVHFPIALAVLVPVFALLGIALIRAKLVPARSWALIVFLQALLVASSWLAVETGEEQEDRVERFVAERHIDAHEESAERFLLIGGVGLLVLGAGLLPGTGGAVARIVGALVTLGGLAVGVSVGHSGGELVYVHGAAAAYVDAAEASPVPAPREGRYGGHDD